MDNERKKWFDCGKYKLELGKKTYVMGIINATPDSFSDGGNYDCIETAVKRAWEMIEEGADIIDVGGESTRPGHIPVNETDEISRVLPIIEILSKEVRVPISIDTSKSVVAQAALKAGANIVNDVWGLQKDSEMAKVISRFDAGVIMMHNQTDKVYSDLMVDIKRFLKISIETAQAAGIKKECMAIDPGVGFGKTLHHNLEVIRRISELIELNLPVLLGTSRKSMIGNILNLPINERVEGTAVTVTLGIAGGVDIVRVHDVKEIARTVKMTDAIIRGWEGE